MQQQQQWQLQFYNSDFTSVPVFYTQISSLMHCLRNTHSIFSNTFCYAEQDSSKCSLSNKCTLLNQNIGQTFFSWLSSQVHDWRHLTERRSTPSSARPQTHQSHHYGLKQRWVGGERWLTVISSKKNEVKKSGHSVKGCKWGNTCIVPNPGFPDLFPVMD